MFWPVRDPNVAYMGQSPFLRGRVLGVLLAVNDCIVGCRVKPTEPAEATQTAMPRPEQEGPA
jgi:hypothetical protein